MNYPKTQEENPSVAFSRRKAAVQNERDQKQVERSKAEKARAEEAVRKIVR